MQDSRKVEFTAMYDKVKAWRNQFDDRAKIDPALAEYYRGMASGLTIALQEIDRERYDREERAQAKPADQTLYMSGEVPQPGDRIYAGNPGGLEEFITVVRKVHGSMLTTAGWPECVFGVAHCVFVERGGL